MTARFREPWTHPNWRERAGLVVTALEGGPLTPEDLSHEMQKVLHTKVEHGVVGAISTAEDLGLVAFDGATGVWSLAEPQHNQRPLPNGWEGYVTPTEIGARFGQGGHMSCGAQPAPRRHFDYTVKRYGKYGPY